MSQTLVETTLNLHWNQYRTSAPLQAICLALALAVHSPLFFMKVNLKKAHWEAQKREHIITDVNIINELPKAATPTPVPVATPKELSWKDKLKALVSKAPPPPPPPPKAVPKAPEKLDVGPKPIDLQAKLDMPKVAPKLEGKSGFKTDNPKMMEDKTISLKPLAPVAAPLSERKLGTLADRSALKNSKGGFQVAKTESLNSIGGSGPALAAGSAPTIAIPVAGKSTKEQFSAPAVSAVNKGRLAGVPAANLGGDTATSLRDKMIARDVASAPIAVSGSRGGVAGGVSGGVDGGTGVKKDAGRFQGSGAGSLGGMSSGLNGTTVAPKIVSAPKLKEKKSLFLITGPLKDRPIEKKILPEYPGWAVAQGIEASVVLEFTVDNEGFVKDNIVVIRTSGYPKLDDSAMKVLRTWKFVALPESRNEEQVGRITFNYSLN